MPITKNGEGEIEYLPASNRFKTDLTGVHPADSFQVCDDSDQLRQVNFDLATMAAASRVKLKFQNPDPDQEIVLTFPDQSVDIAGGGVVGEAFTIIQPDSGTSPTATGPNDVLSLTSDSDALAISGDAGTDTITFSLSPPGSFDRLLKKDGDGHVVTHESLSVNAYNGLNNQLDVSATSSNGGSINLVSARLLPTENSPDSAYTHEFHSVEIDPNESGFSVGTNGNALTMHNHNLVHTGTSDVGGLAFHSHYFNLGNGTDPIDVKGISYSYGFGEAQANVNFNGPLQGYGFQPYLHTGVTLDNSAYVNAFYDYATIEADVGAYSSFSCGPTIDSVRNNANYTAFNNNASITTFTGNAGYNGLALSPTLGTFDTGSFNGININPTVGSVDFAAGINVTMDNVTATSKYAAFLDGDVNITGALSFGGALSIGQLNAYAQLTLQTGAGVPVSVHNLISAYDLPANTSVTTSDNIGTNTACLITIGDNASLTSGAIGLGIAALALPAVASLGTGASVDNVSGAVFAMNLDATATGGTIDTLALCRSITIPNGVTAVTRLMGYKFDLPFGDPGTTTWGVYMTPTAHNYFAGDLMIGGTAGSDDVVANSSVGLELKSTSKAVLLSRLTTTERNALTAVDGMLVYNTTSSKFQGYAGGSWVDLH